MMLSLRINLLPQTNLQKLPILQWPLYLPVMSGMFPTLSVSLTTKTEALPYMDATLRSIDAYKRGS